MPNGDPPDSRLLRYGLGLGSVLTVAVVVTAVLAVMAPWDAAPRADRPGGASPAASSTGSPASPATSPASPAPSAVTGSPTRLWGVTLDDVDRLDEIVASLDALPARPTVRIDFAVGTAPAEYAEAVEALRPRVDLVGRFPGADALGDVSRAAYARRVRRFLRAFSSRIDVWEIGTDVNGEELGRASDVRAKVSDAYRRVRAAGGRTMLTLRHAPDCHRPAHDLHTWARVHVPRGMRAGLDHVAVSYSPRDCEGFWPDAEHWQEIFDRLHLLFPRALLTVATADTAWGDVPEETRLTVLRRFHRVRVSGDHFVGGVFWSSYADDAVPHTRSALWAALAGEMTAAGAHR